MSSSILTTLNYSLVKYIVGT